MNKKLKCSFGRMENIVGKGENAGYPQCFQKPSASGLLKVWIVWLRDKRKGEGAEKKFFYLLTPFLPYSISFSDSVFHMKSLKFLVKN